MNNLVLVNSYRAKRRILLSAVLVTILLATFLSHPAHAETVIVKYRGPVDLAPFTCTTVTRSSLVNRVCYDQREQYMLIALRGIWYHYCETPQPVVAALLSAESMGRYYNERIRGAYDCRLNRMPAYDGR